MLQAAAHLVALCARGGGLYLVDHIGQRPQPGADLVQADMRELVGGRVSRGLGFKLEAAGLLLEAGGVGAFPWGGRVRDGGSGGRNGIAPLVGLLKGGLGSNRTVALSRNGIAPLVGLLVQALCAQEAGQCAPCVQDFRAGPARVWAAAVVVGRGLSGDGLLLLLRSGACGQAIHFQGAASPAASPAAASAAAASETGAASAAAAAAFACGSPRTASAIGGETA